MGRSYKGITFPDEGLDITYPDFKEAFGGSEDFRFTPEEDREAAIKEAYKIATKKDGKLPAAAPESKENNG